MIGEDHGLATSIQAEAQRGAQNSTESLQEISAGPQQLFRGQKNREDQNPSGQKGRDLAGTVQSIPATLLSIAALVTAAICKVVGAVLLIHRVAGTFAATSVAVKVVIEAGWGAAGWVTPAVVEETPALQCLTLPPGVVHVQRAIAAVPATARGVAFAIAILVPSLGLAGGSRAPWLLGNFRGCRRGLATQACPARSAYTAEERDDLHRQA